MKRTESEKKSPESPVCPRPLSDSELHAVQGGIQRMVVKGKKILQN